MAGGKGAGIRIIRFIFHIVLFLITTVFFLFGLFSGAQTGLNGFLKNLPNALPWLLLYIINIVTLRNEVAGGCIMIGLAFFLFFFFHIIPQGNWAVFFIFLLPILVLGSCSILLGIFSKKRTQGF